MSSLGYLSCGSPKEIFFKLSLAQWSLHKAIQGGEMSPYLFAEKSKEFLDSSKAYDDPIVTQIVPAPEFYKAEDYHQKYFKKQGF